VSFGDAHDNQQAHEFQLSLIRDPRFAATVDDIVVTIGNARYQDLMDRFVRGEEVPHASLRKVWQDTTAPNTSGDLATHEELFRAVRDANRLLPRRRGYRSAYRLSGARVYRTGPSSVSITTSVDSTDLMIPSARRSPGR
jgi:hypothetical protein